MRTGINIQRRVLGGSQNNIFEEINSFTREGNPPLIFRGVVLEVFFDPHSLATEDREQIKTRVRNPEVVDIMPPNSLLVRLVSDSQDFTNSSPVVVFPFFSSHFQLPVQAGEHVGIVYEDFQNNGPVLGKWLDRIQDTIITEDPNFSHADRRFEADQMPENRRLSDQQQPYTTASFTNGGGIPENYTLAQENLNTNPYDTIFNTAQASKLGTYEPVPRYIKRPNELVLQGQNNSLVVLGQDRNGPALRVTGSNQTDQTNKAGSIDLVCGRSRFGLTPLEDPSDLKPTSPVVIQNSRGKTEVDKSPHRRNKRKNKKEGDPDFRRDAARILISQNTLGDKNFNLVHSTDPQKGIEYPQNTLHVSQPRETGTEDYGRSYVVEKADNIRIVARKETAPSSINGTVLVIKEGTKDQDLAYIFINEKGHLQVEGSKIFLGKSVTNENAAENNGPEPYIKWSEYKNAIQNLQNQINQLKSYVEFLTTQANAAVAVPYAPIASLAPPATQATLTTAKTEVERLERELVGSGGLVDKSKSKKIFGE